MKRILIAFLIVACTSNFAFAERQLQQLPKRLRGFWYVVGFKDHRTGKYKKTSVNPEMFIYAAGEQLHYMVVLSVKDPNHDASKWLTPGRPRSMTHDRGTIYHDYQVRNEKGYMRYFPRLYAKRDIGDIRHSFALVPITSVTRRYNFDKSRFEYTVVVRDMNRVYVIYRNGKYCQFDGFGEKVRKQLGFNCPREKQRGWDEEPRYLLKSYNLRTGEPVYTVGFLISEYDQYIVWRRDFAYPYSHKAEENKKYWRKRRSCFGRSGCCLLPNYK